MANRIQFFQNFGEEYLPVKKLSPKILKKMDPEMRHYINGLRRANKYNPNDTTISLHTYEFDGKMGIAINGQKGNIQDNAVIEQGCSDCPFTAKGLKQAIRAMIKRLKNY